MPFTPAQFPLLNAQQASPYANLVQNALSNYTNAVQAKYAPRLMQSQIFGQQFAPLAAIASSPLASAMLPDQRQQIIKLISQLLNQTGSGGNPPPSQNNNMQNISSGQNQGIPAPMQSNGNMTSGSSQTMPSTNADNSQSNPNLPSSNLQQGAQQKMTGTYRQQIVPPGTAYITLDGKQMVAPTMNSVDQAQQALTAIDGFTKLAPQIKRDAKEFADPESGLDTMRAGVATVLNKWGLPGEIVSNDPDKAGRYSTYKTETAQAADLLKLIFPNANSTSLYERYADMTIQHPTDTYNSYKDRMDKIVSELQTQIRPVIQKQMGSEGGYNLNATGQAAIDESKYVVGISKDGKTVKMRTPDGVYWNVPNDPDTIDKALRLIRKQMGSTQQVGASQ